MRTTTKTGSYGPRHPAGTFYRWVRKGFIEGGRGLAGYLRAPVTFSRAFPPLLLLSALLFTRSLWTNYIFDEQEALLANPYVNGDQLGFWQVFERDFWGLPPKGTIGSYRPLPNMIWRLLWRVREHAWLPHWFNVVFHGLNGAALAGLTYRWVGSVRTAWFAGVIMVSAAIVTEAVCGVVGIADVLSGTFTLAVLYSLRLAMPYQLPLAFVGVFLGLLAKESMLTVVPMLATCALLTAPLDHPERPCRVSRTTLVFVGSVLAVVAYTYFRRHFFPVAPSVEALPDDASWVRRAFHAFLQWFRQPALPKNGINNPLVEADLPHRVAGALRVYFRGLGQVVLPWRLSGDYSYPQEPIPTKVLFPESLLGGAAMVLPPVVGAGLWLQSVYCERLRPVLQASESSLNSRRRVVAALALIWVPVTYFPHSNIPLLLPTVRAERFWYLPIVGTSLLLALAFAALMRRPATQRFGYGLFAAFLTFQALRARAHAFDYSSDLDFWRSTSRAAPRSAKAHLNYGVMLGAREQLEARLVENRRATELAPHWPMGLVYVGDVLCRLKRVEEAWPYYLQGFKLGPNQQGLIALALQCMWDERAIFAHRDELEELISDYPGTWIAYLSGDILSNGEKHGGVAPKYRPRGYDQGPKKKSK